MPITEDFNTFANTYHKNTGGKYLPAPTLCFDIMELVGEQVNIIRKNKEYKKNYNEMLDAIENVGRYMNMFPDGLDYGVSSDQFFCELYHQDSLTNTISIYRRNK